ncbi:MAG TPA: 50S ribosomal protein L32 [Elusimicrobiota bacterium]|jgi:large subunit ribosomal protein L32|nr:50S ribosomal protein L32 [Elusimicrobiota bacterium]
MPNPKHKHSRSRRDSRRAQNWKLETSSMSVCENPACKKLRQPHRVCPHCGFYNGKLVVPKREKKSKKSEGEAGGEQ